MFNKILSVSKNKKEYEILLLFDEPIPSCKIDSLIYKNNKWFFVYKTYSPIDITDKNDDLNLVIYGHISDLQLEDASSLNPLSVNIKINSFNEYINFLNLQIKADKEYRKQFKKKLKYNRELENSIQLNVVELLNKDYNNDDIKKENITYIANIYRQNDDFTIFSAV